MHKNNIFSISPYGGLRWLDVEKKMKELGFEVIKYKEGYKVRGLTVKAAKVEREFTNTPFSKTRGEAIKIFLNDKNSYCDELFGGS